MNPRVDAFYTTILDNLKLDYAATGKFKYDMPTALTSLSRRYTLAEIAAYIGCKVEELKNS